MNLSVKFLSSASLAAACAALLVAQGPAGKGPAAKGGGKGPAPSALSVTSSAFPDGSEVPLKYAFAGENKSPDFTFHWTSGTAPAQPPADLVSYAVILHDIENATRKGPTDTLHWSAYNIPGTAPGLPEGLPAGDLPDGTRNGPGIGANRPNGTPSYFGPGAGPGPFHHYVFEFFALDTKLDLEPTASRDQLMQAIDGHIIGKAAYVGRYHRTDP